jgi:RHS repeat-associated protein
VFTVLGDHLGSTSAMVDATGAVVAQQYYYPYGANRGGAQSDLTERRYTGQYQETGLAGTEGLYYYNARWYDAAIGRFVQADTIVPSPGNPQSLNRYAYVYNNPQGYTDPSGHIGDPDRDRTIGGRIVTWRPFLPAHQRSQPMFVAWYEGDVDLPSIYRISSGGAYGYGQMEIAGRSLSLYVPPIVWYPGNEATFELYDPKTSGASLRPQDAFIGDYSWGDEDANGSGTVVRAGTWERAATWSSMERPRMDEFLIGAHGGIASLPDGGPPAANPVPAELVVDLGATGLAGLAGGLAAGRENTFLLQENASGDLRLIVITSQISSKQSYYAAYSGLFTYPRVWNGPAVTSR